MSPLRRVSIKRLGLNLIAGLLVVGIVRPWHRRLPRWVSAVSLTSLWGLVYWRYRDKSKKETLRQFELMRSATWEAYTRHYAERVPTIEEEFDVWGEYHQHRHEMRYDLVAESVGRHLPQGGSILDIGCGSALVADRLIDRAAYYVGMDFGPRHVAYAAARFAGERPGIRARFVRGDAEQLPFADNSFDVVVISEVIEHLLRPQKAVWEMARVLRPGGHVVLTTNNASEAPLRSPLTHLLAWLEKALGADRAELISLRPWVWPHPIDADLLPPGAPPIYLPHTHHIYAETRGLMAAAGLQAVAWSTFEFPPPQSATAGWLDRHGEMGRKTVDLIEAVATRLPLVKRLGCHLLIEAHKTGTPVAPAPPVGIWPGPDYG
jgi:ubiquinone/menaquinone biosynthesis C-methylase UbiE